MYWFSSGSDRWCLSLSSVRSTPSAFATASLDIENMASDYSNIPPMHGDGNHDGSGEVWRDTSSSRAALGDAAVDGSAAEEVVHDSAAADTTSAQEPSDETVETPPADGDIVQRDGSTDTATVVEEPMEMGDNSQLDIHGGEGQVQSSPNNTVNSTEEETPSKASETEEALRIKRQQLLNSFLDNLQRYEANQTLLDAIEGQYEDGNGNFMTVPPHIGRAIRDRSLGTIVCAYEKEREEKGGVEGIKTTVDDTGPLSLEDLSLSLFAPGMKFRGHIRIPGINNNSEAAKNDTYELVVIKRGVDLLGNEFLLARHSAYEDEQCVHIKLKISVEECDERSLPVLRAEYGDGETVCKGYWNVQQHRLEGNVRQRVQVNDGVFHTSDAVTHVFTLYPCTNEFPLGRDGAKEEDSKDNARGMGNGCEETRHDEVAGAIGGTDEAKSPPSLSSFEADLLSLETRAIISCRRQTHDDRRQLILGINQFYSSMNIGRFELPQLQLLLSAFSNHRDNVFQQDEKLGLLFQLRDVKWKELLAAISMHAEEIVAEFRRRASLLDETCFETNLDRDLFIRAFVKKANMGFGSAHEEMNECEMLSKNIGSLIFAFDNSMATSTGLYRVNVMRHRFRANYNCFESAYRRAEARLSLSELAKYEATRSSLQLAMEGVSNEDDATCAICQSSLLESEDGEEKDEKTFVVLPCKHGFHRHCAKQWLHDHSSCPVCRSDLTSVEELPLDSGEESFMY